MTRPVGKHGHIRGHRSFSAHPAPRQPKDRNSFDCNNTRDETRTRMTIAGRGILSPLCLPIPPPGQILLLQQLTELCDHN